MVESQNNTRFDFDFSESEFQQLRQLVLAHTGIYLAEEKKQLTYSRFAKRLRALGMTSFAEYHALVESGDEEEIQNFVSAITTNFTSFFREPHHFELLKEFARERLSVSSKLRVWSAGCSSGEEPYSIAISLLEAIPDLARRDVKILATDLDRKMVERASSGIYDADRVKDIPSERLFRWFRKGRGANAGKVRVSDEVRSLITFRQLNLMEEWPVRGPFDFIFCRNVIIYFSKDVQRGLFAKFASRQQPGGKLFIGHSENLSGVTDDYKLIGKTVYERV